MANKIKTHALSKIGSRQGGEVETAWEQIVFLTLTYLYLSETVKKKKLTSANMK